MSEFSFFTQVITDMDFDSRDNEYKVIVLLALNSDNQDLISQDIMGKRAEEYLFETAKGFDTQIFPFSNELHFDEIANNFKDKYDYIVLLFCDTPLVTSATLHDAIDYATTKVLDFCSLHRGCIFSTKIADSGICVSAKADFLNKEDFIKVFDMQSLSLVRSIMKKRIIDNHLRNGINFLDADSCYIESDVTIFAPATVAHNNILKGKTIVGKGTKILENNVITNCNIGENCEIFNCSLENIKLKDNAKLENVVKKENIK